MKFHRIMLGLIISAISFLNFNLVQAQIFVQQDQILKSDDGTTHVVTTGRIRVPELRDSVAAPAGTIELAFIRVKRSQRPSRSAHFVLAGGPGESGVQLVRNIVQRGGAELVDIFDGDIVGIDQRGTGESAPNLALERSYKLPQDKPGSIELWQPVIEKVAQSVAEEFRARGIHLEAYNTWESAEDMNDVRIALEYEKISLWGRSYGSHLALAVLKQHKNAVDRMILIGPEGPNHTLKLPSQADLVLTKISALANEPKLLSIMKAVIQKLKTKPVSVKVLDMNTKQSVVIEVGAFDVQWVTTLALSNPRAIKTLPSAYRKMAKGDFTSIGQLVWIFRNRLSVESAMKHMMDASSGASSTRRKQIAQDASSSVLGNALNFPVMYFSDVWSAKDLGENFRSAVASDVPTLILVGDLDVKTPVSNGLEIAKTLPNAKVITIENALHQFDVFGSSPIREVLSQFLRNELVTEKSIALAPINFQ